MSQKSGFDEHIKPVAKQRIHDQISHQINIMISEGFLRPGDQLPSERDLAERFKVSRNSVRDALRTLEAKGLIEILQGEGAYVREVPTSDLYQHMIEVLAERKVLTRELIQLREFIEPSIAYSAAKHVTPEYIARLEEILERHEEKALAGDPGVEEDSSFHLTIAEMVDNQYLIWLLQLINESFEDTRDILLEYVGSVARVGHRRIVQALKDQDSGAAQEAMRAHLTEVKKAYELHEDGEDMP
jgi:GntR family transcriptional regulator, transcriptional repressor for pyruvate dehydrogenase complex